VIGHRAKKHARAQYDANRRGGDGVRYRDEDPLWEGKTAQCGDDTPRCAGIRGESMSTQPGNAVNTLRHLHPGSKGSPGSEMRTSPNVTNNSTENKMPATAAARGVRSWACVSLSWPDSMGELCLPE
jgi:hypothetical protein